jgi:4-oxalocrotonate tautomerase
MPHVTVKLASGRSDAQKAALADAVTKAVIATADVGEDAVSVAIEDVPKKDWVEQVYRPEILPKLSSLHKKPGYDPL